MKVLIYNGGTSNKNTNLVVNKYKDLCIDRGIEVVFLDDYFKDCINCQFCSKNKRCCIPDQLSEVLSTEKFDAVVIATPIYFFNFSGKAKSFLDRLYCLDKSNLIFSILCVSGSPYEESGIDLVEEIMLRACEFCGSYSTSTFYKTTFDEYTGHLTDSDVFYLNRIIEEMENLYGEIKNKEEN